jgi:hypothetical protein
MRSRPSGPFSDIHSLISQIGGCAALVAFIAGLIPNRLTYLVAAVGTIISAIGLCVSVSAIPTLKEESLIYRQLCSGAAVWTVLISKNNFLNIVKVQGGRSLGINITAGPSLCTSCLSSHHSPHKADRKSFSFHRFDLGRLRLLRTQRIPLRSRRMHIPKVLECAFQS